MFSELVYVYTEEEVRKKLKAYEDAEIKTLLSQEYKISDRMQKRALLLDIKKGAEKWEQVLLAHKKLKDKRIRRGPTVSRVGYRA